MLSNCKDIHTRWILARQMSQAMAPILSSQPLWEQCRCVAARRASMGAGTGTAEPSWCQTLPFPLWCLPNRQDRIKALEVTSKPAGECLCSHLVLPPTVGKILIRIWTMNYHTALSDYIFILSSSFFSWNQFIDMFTRTFFSHVFFLH